VADRKPRLLMLQPVLLCIFHLKIFAPQNYFGVNISRCYSSADLLMGILAVKILFPTIRGGQI